MTTPPLPLGPTSAVVSSIRQAARATNIDFGLLIAQAQQESGFRADAKASGSSATGLYQFIDSTWLSLVQRFGAQYGVGDLAEHITTTAAGRPSVADPALRQRILDLRLDPRLSAALGAEYTKLNKAQLETALGRPVGNGELYLAHFLGAGGATSFLRTLQQDGNARAADLLPDAAAANPAVFYDRSGQARTVAQLFHDFAGHIEQESRRFSDGGGPAAAIGASTAASAPARLQPASSLAALGFSPGRLDPATVAMLDVFAFAAARRESDAPRHQTLRL